MKREEAVYIEIHNDVFADSYYAKVNYSMKNDKVNEKDYFIISDNIKIGILHMGNTIEFKNKFGIGVIGILPQYRNKGYLKKIINICKKIAKQKKETTLFLSIPKDAYELKTIFTKLGFKYDRLKTTITFDDCHSFGMLTDNQLKHLDLSKPHKEFAWQQLVLEL